MITVNNIDYPRVTEIIRLLDKSSVLMEWVAKVTKDGGDYKKESLEARNIGSEVHNKINYYIKKYKIKLPDGKSPLSSCFNAFLKWEYKFKPEFISSELRVIDNEFMYTGILDLIVKINNEIWLIDVKTSSGIYDGYDLQLAAYKQAYEKQTNKKIDGMAILRLDKNTGEYEWKDYTKNYNKLFESFTNLLDFYYNYKKRRLKNNRRVK